MPSKARKTRTVRKPAAADTPAAPPARAPLERAQRLEVARGDERFEFRDRLPLLPLRDVVDRKSVV